MSVHTLPPFLVKLLREHLAATDSPFVFTTRTGCPIRRSTFDRRVFRPAVDGDARHNLPAVRPGLTFHGPRHSHKTWLIADRVPEIAQAWRLGHHLANRLVEVYSHVAPEIERHLLDTLEQRYRHVRRSQRPNDTRPRNRRSRMHAHHTAPAQRTTATPRQKISSAAAHRPATSRSIIHSGHKSAPELLQQCAITRSRFTWTNNLGSHERALRPGLPPASKGLDQLWS